MKKLVTAFLFGVMALPISATELTIIDEIEPLVLNGKELSRNDYQSSQVIRLQPGQNQLLFALDQLVVEDGRRNKLVFPAVVIKFDAGSSPVSLSYPVFRHVDQAKKFRNNLDFALVDEQGQPVEHQVDLLHIKGFSHFSDYELAVDEYNRVGGIASVTQGANVKTDTHSNQVAPQAVVQTKQVAVQASSTIKDDFLSMTPTERQEFISWAVKHINH